MMSSPRWSALLVALVPAILMMVYVYRLDRVDKEPADLLVELAMLGVAAAIVASVVEVIWAFVVPDIPGYTGLAIHMYIGIGMVEEGCKALFLHKRVWHERNFDCTFDAVVYAVFVSMGFAALENVIYVFSYGMITGVIRAVTAIPGHFSFAVAFGVFYGKACLHERRGESGLSRFFIAMGYLVAVLLHGTYDFCAYFSAGRTALVFYGFIIVLYTVIFIVVRREARDDSRM